MTITVPTIWIILPILIAVFAGWMWLGEKYFIPWFCRKLETSYQKRMKRKYPDVFE